VNPGVRCGILAVAAVVLGACAFVPRPNPRLDEARTALERASADSRIAVDGAAELAIAAEGLRHAIAAHDGLDDPARVDHLAYVAKQRVAIATEAARLRASRQVEGLLVTSSADPTCAGGKCRGDASVAGRRITVFPGGRSTSP
jgi:hypothetical protein